MPIVVGFTPDESDGDQLYRRPDKAFAALVKQNKVEVKLKNLSAEDRVKLPGAKDKEVKSFLKYRACEAASRAGVHPGALMKTRWAITRKETGDLKARLVVLGFTDLGLGKSRPHRPHAAAELAKPFWALQIRRASRSSRAM